jgi:hypothetical protein
MSLGPTAGCVIRLWPDEAVTLGLVIGEGWISHVTEQIRKRTKAHTPAGD